MKRKGVIVTFTFLLLVAAIAGAFCYFFLPNNKVVPAFEEDKLNLVVDGEVVESEELPRVVDEEILLPMDVIKKYFDPNIFWDDQLKKVTITTKDRVVRMKTESLDAFVNNKPVTLKIPVTEEKKGEEKIIYVPIEFLSEFYNIEINYIKEKNVIIIDNKKTVKQIAEPIEQDSVIRKGRSTSYPIIRKLDLGGEKPEERQLRVFEEYDKWYKVRTWDGAIGYIEKKFVVVKQMVAERIPGEEQARTAWKPEKGKINLVWDMMYEKRTGGYKEEKIQGLDVISPTWFQVANDKGILINRADAKYVEWAHKNGYKVWALFSNDSSDPAMTHRFLTNTDARDAVIKQLLVFASLYKLDGINIDFENINIEDKGALTQFVREVTPLLKEQGMVVSMDVTPVDGSANWSQCYDRPEIAKVVDYVALMAYDQNWPNFGPNAQLPWVESSLQKVLKQVPKEKLLLGIPTYTRVWKEETDKSGKVKNTHAMALSIEAAKKAVVDNKGTVKWDEKSGQFYAEYKKDGVLYKTWLENNDSIDMKSALIQKYKLAGAAIWNKNLGDKSAWEALNKNLKEIDNYQEWKLASKDNKYVFD